MTTTDTAYSARFELPDFIEQYRNNTLKCRVYRAGELVSPVSGTVSIYDASNVAFKSAVSVTISSSVATYSILASDMSSQPRGEGWRIEWTLTMPDGIVHVFRNDAAIVKARLYAPITEADLYRRCPAIDPSGNAPLTSQSNFASFIDESWVMIQHKLINKGNRPNLIMTPSALRSVHIALTLALIFDDMASRDNLSFADRAKAYHDEYEEEWDELRFEYDTTDDGDSDSRKKQSAVRSIWTC